MFQKHLVDEGNLLYADFMNDLAKIMAYPAMIIIVS